VRRRLLATGCAAAALLTACGSSETAPAPTTGQSTTSSATGHGAYAACLAEHGVPNPPLGPAAPPGVDAQTWAQAQQACADKAPGPAG
jgi:hypothetical protein